MTILILEYASLFYASPSHPSLLDALDKAFSQYSSSDCNDAVKRQFVLPPEQYYIPEFTEFVLSHRLS